jgi:hypothetical protein
MRLSGCSFAWSVKQIRPHGAGLPYPKGCAPRTAIKSQAMPTTIRNVGNIMEHYTNGADSIHFLILCYTVGGAYRCAGDTDDSPECSD